jgi:hypothetical protein
LIYRILGGMAMICGGVLYGVLPYTRGLRHPGSWFLFGGSVLVAVSAVIGFRVQRERTGRAPDPRRQ